MIKPSQFHSFLKMSFDPSQPPLIEETLLKKRRSLDELALRRSETLTNPNQKRRVSRGEDVKIKRPEQFIREARIKEGSLKKMNRRKSVVEARRQGTVVPKSEIKKTVGVAVRIHGGRHSNELIKAELKELGLNKKYDAVFVKLDNEGIANLKHLDAYVTYGYVTNKSVVEMVHRRSYIVVDGVRKPLSDNVTVEKLLGDKDILCLNDLSHEIYSVGPNFGAAVKVFCPFKLSSPVGHYEKKVLNIHEKVEERGGFLGDKMDAFLNKIL